MAVLPDARGALKHRWGFDETGGSGTTLADMLGGANLTIEEIGANNADVGITYPGQVHLAGGAKDSSDYVKLPVGAISAMTDDATIELWATQRSVQNWSRIWDFGVDVNDRFNITWTRATTLTQDEIVWTDTGVVAGDNNNGVNDSLAPYTLNQEFHIVFVIDVEATGPGTKTVVKWYKDGVYKGTLDTYNKLSDLGDTGLNTLGRSRFGDNTANATYNEFRIYDHAMTATEVTNNYLLGPNAMLYPAFPTVPTDVTQTSATLNGQVTMTNGSTYVWIYWGSSDGGTNKLSWGNNALIAGGQQATGLVSTAISLLTPQTPYYYRLYVSNAVWQVFSSTVGSFATLNSMTWDGDVDDLWWNTNNWAGSNVPDTTNEYAVFSITGVGGVDLQELSYSIGSLTFLYGGYNIVDPNETPGTLTMGSITNAAGTNTINVGVTLSGDAVVKAGQLILADPNDFNAGSIVLSGGDLTVQGALTMTPGKLNFRGYEINNESLHNLNGNGGLLLQTPYAEVFLTTGPSDRGLNFDTDAEFQAAGVVSVADYYMTVFEGYFIAPETGSYEFRVNQDDDRSSMWLDLDRDGVFEAPSGYNTGECLSWETYATRTVSLTAGNAYRFAVTHQEFAGGSGIDVSFKTPSTGAHAAIKPGDVSQSAYWAVGTMGSEATEMDVPVTVATNSTLKVVSDAAVSLGELVVFAGSTLTIVCEGSSPGVTFTDAAITGNLTITSGDVVLNNFTQSANTVITLNGGDLTVDAVLNLKTLDTSGTVSAPGTITASTKMSFEPTRTITNVLAGGAAVYYGENRLLNGMITPTAANTYSGGTWIRRTILRAAGGGGLPAAGCLRFWSGNGNGEDALLETSGTFTRNIGTGSGEVYWEGSGGFSALGGPLDVTLEGGATLDFGGANNGFRGQYLQLNSDNSDNVVDLKNNINLTTGNRNIYIRDNTTTKVDMAILSGTISSGASSGNWIYRRGAGLLWITGTNTFQHRLFFEDCGPIRADEGVGIPTTCMIRFDQNNTAIPAVWETKGTINRNLDADGVASALHWNTAGGFSAYGGKLTVNLNGGATIDWGANPTGFNNQWLLFGSPYSDNEVELTNPINLTTGDRNVGVFDNPDTNTDVTVLSGVISGTGSTVWFRKQRPGVLWLKGANTFQQRILLEDGVIRGQDGTGISPNCSFRFDQGDWDNNYQGVWESSGTITRDIGDDGVAGTLRWNENGGFAAYGGALTVNLQSGAQLDTKANPGLNDRQLHLGSSTATHPVDFQNDLFFNNDGMRMRIFDNPYTTNDYAILSGDMTYTTAGDLELEGYGLVKLTGSNVMRNLRLEDTVQVMINNYWRSADWFYTENNESPVLGGTGTLEVVNWMDIRTGGTIAPGDNGVGTLNIIVDTVGSGYGLDLWNGAICEYELGGITNDRVALTGDLVLNNSWTLKLLDAGASPKSSDQFDVFTYTLDLYTAMSGSNVASVVIDCSSLPSHYVTNSVEVIHDAVNKRIYVTGLSSTLSIGNEEASSITDVAADLNGVLSCTGETFEVYAYWGTTDRGASTSGWDNTAYVGQYSDVTGEALNHPVGSLTGNTDYYYTFRASNDTYDIWASVSESFTTFGIPIVTNGSGASSVRAGKAELNGAFVGYNRGDVTICWGLTDAGTNDMSLWDHSELLGTVSAANFTSTVTEIFYPQTYYYRCFATNAYGYGWSGPASSFSVTAKPEYYAPPDGLLGIWTFDDDTCDDLSTNGYDGVNVGGSYATDVPAALTGGKSMNLTGGDYYVKVDTGGSQDVFDLDELSVSCWVKGWPDGVWEPYVAKQGEAGGWQLRRQGDSVQNVAWTLRGPGDNDDWSATAYINDFTWHHLVATYDGGRRRLYLDNTLVGEEIRTGTIADNTDMLTFGARQYGGTFGWYSRIQLDDIYIYDRAITSDEVGLFYNNTLRTLISITNTAVIDVTTTSAQFNAILSVSNAAYQIFGYWGTNNGGTDIEAWSNSVDLGFYTNYVGGINYYTTNDINTTTTNYYTFRVTNALDNIWAAPSWSFHTVIAPTVDNGSGAVTTAVGVATLRGALTAGNYANVYIYWGTNDGVEVKGDWSGVVSMGGKFDGTFETNVPVGHGVTYYYRCYATNAAGENWAGSTETFIMSVPPLLPPLTVTNGLNYQLAADLLGSNNNDQVAQWVDMSGNARHFSQGTAASQPIFKTGYINGLPAVSFDGNDDRVTWSTITSNEMVFIVNRVISVANNEGIWGSDNPGDRGIRLKDGDEWHGELPYFYVNDYSYTEGVSYINGSESRVYGATNTWHILMQKRGSSHNLTYNATHFGWYYTGRAFHGDIAEVLVYNRVLSTNEHNLVGNYLAQKYGLTSLYPVVHYLHLTNNAPTSIAATEATFNATLNGNGRVFHVYVYWDEIDGGNNVGAWTGGSAYVGAFTNLDGAVSYNATTDLAGGTAYYYNFRATNDFTNLWGGASVAFSTLSSPIVSNAAATGVTSSSAMLNGVLTAGGSASARIYWGTNDIGNFYSGWDNTNEIGTVIEGALFSENVPVLAGGTYYYRVYVTNSVLNEEAWPGSATNFTALQAAVSLSLGVTGFSPTNLAGCVLWLDASDIDGDSDTGDNPVDGAAIYSWNDRSGSGHNADNSMGTPQYVIAGLNSKPVVRFVSDQREYLYTTYNFDALSKYSILSVARYSGGAPGRVLSSKTRNWLFGFNYGETRQFNAEGTIYDGNVLAGTNWYLHAGTINDNANPLASFWENGTLLVSGNGGSSDTVYKPGQLALGAFVRDGREYADCEVAEVLIYDRVLSESDMTMVGDYLAQKYGLATSYTSVELTETNMALLITATLSVPAISNVTVNLQFPAAKPAALRHWGYNFNNDTLHNLDGNGGLLTSTPYGRAFLEAGPNSNGLAFTNDWDWMSSGAVSISDNYMNLIHGYLNVQTTGNHEFRISWEDDVGTIWLDLDCDGVFEHVGDNGDEQIVFDNSTGTITKSLTAGSSYRFAATHREAGGGSALVAWIKTPSMGGQAVIKPTDPAQQNLWTYDIEIVTNTDYTMSATSIVITAGSLTGSVTLTPVDDVLQEEDEAVQIGILSTVNATSGAPSSVMTLITSDDPEVSNYSGASNVTWYSASLAGMLTMGDVAWVTVYYGTNDGGTTQGNWGSSVSMGRLTEDIPFSVSVTGLLANTRYYYRCYSTNESLLGEDWSDGLTDFTTLGPTVSIGDRSLIVERDVGTVGLVLTVTMSETNASAVSVNFTTLDGTAVAGIDYLGTNGTLTIPAGQTNGQIVVRVINDTVFDPPPKVFLVVLSSPVGCSILDGRANVTILDNDAATYLSDWQYGMQITFTNSATEALINWPALVRLSTNITGFSYARFSSVTGGDLRFSTGDGKSVLVYSIENWNTNGESTVWVQVPQLPVGGTNIWVYWGNPSGTAAPSYTTDSSTWDANYMGTWHLHADAQDATANNIDGTVYGASVVISGAVANAWNFDGANDYIEIARPVQDDFTISFWMRPDIAGRGDANWYNGYGLVDGEMSGSVNDFGIGYNNTGGYNQPVFGTGNPDQTLNSGIAVNDGNWHHVAVTRRKSTGAKIIYVDGKARASQVATTVSLTSPAKLKFGEILNGNYNYDGRLDEIRISDTVRSASWISCSYTNQKPGSMANLIGAVRGKPLIVTTNGATNVTATSAYLTAYLISTGAAPATVWLCWGTNNGAQVESQWNTVTLIGAVTAVPTNYSTELPTLTAGTAYYYAYMASNTYGKYWAATNFYTTGKPFVENSAGAIEGSVSATLRGNLVSTGALVTTVFTYWGDNDGGMSTGSWDYVIAGGVLPQGSFSNNTASILVYGKQYYYRCYATNSAGVNWAATTELFLSTNPRVNDGSKMKISFPGYVGPTLTNIPMLVVLGEDKPGFTYDGFLSGEGNDLRFWNSTETVELNYEIERWSTNYDFEPTTLSGCTLWLDASDIDGYGDGSTGDPGDGQSATVWKDKSPSGNAARLASGAPMVVVNGLGGCPVVRFTGGAAQDMDFDNSVTAQGSTVFVMYKKTTNIDGDWQEIMDNGSGGELHVKRNNTAYYGNSERCFDYDGAGLDIMSGISASEWHAQAMQLVAGTNKLWIDEKLFGPDASTNTFGPFIDIGNMNMDLAEVIVYNRVLTDDERQKVGGYLAAKYDLDCGYTPNDQSYVWVQIPQLAASNTYIWATWGDTNRVSKPAYTTDGSTWNNGYKGVWHLDEIDGTEDLTDSSPGAHDGVDGGTGGTTNIAGIIASAQKFDGNDYVEVSYSADLELNAYTISSWVKLANEPGNYGILGTRFGGDTTFDLKVRATDIHGDIGSGTGWLDGGVDIRSTDTGSNGQGGDLAVGTWHMVTYAIKSGTYELYIDGDLKRTISGAGTPLLMKSGQTMRLGNSYGTECMNGIIDEVRVENVARSSNWIWACWMNMASNDVFNVYSNAVDSRVIENRSASHVQDIRAQFNGVLYAKSATYDVYVYWGKTDGGTNHYGWASNAFVGNYTYVSSNNVSYTAQGYQRLIPETNYFYTFFATNIAGGYWAYPSISLRTEPPYPSLFKIF